MYVFKYSVDFKIIKNLFNYTNSIVYIKNNKRIKEIESLLLKLLIL